MTHPDLNHFFWEAPAVRAFYQSLAPAPVERVVLGELVCSKRLPFWQDEIGPAVEALLAAGKDVAITSLALVTLKRERKTTAALAEIGLPVEVNDLTALHCLPKGVAFWVGPLINVYNEGTLRWLARRGATRACLPPELPLESIAVLARLGRDLGVAIEVWGHGRFHRCPLVRAFRQLGHIRHSRIVRLTFMRDFRICFRHGRQV